MNQKSNQFIFKKIKFIFNISISGYMDSWPTPTPIFFLKKAKLYLSWAYKLSLHSLNDSVLYVYEYKMYLVHVLYTYKKRFYTWFIQSNILYKYNQSNYYTLLILGMFVTCLLHRNMKIILNSPWLIKETAINFFFAVLILQL